MNELSSMIWVELRKAFRSRMPLWTTIGSLYMPLGIAFLIYLARNPQISELMGLVDAKANLLAFAMADWLTYMNVYGEIIGAGGLFLFVIIIAWIFGREFSDQTVKDILAVPIRRSSILIAKFIVAGMWSIAMTLIIFVAGLVMGFVIRLPGFSFDIALQGAGLVMFTALLVLVVILPFAFFASIGRGILLPIVFAAMVIILIMFAQVLGVAQYFPWAVPLLYAQGKIILEPISFQLVFLTGLAGLLVTYFWWMRADQSR